MRTTNQAFILLMGVVLTAMVVATGAVVQATILALAYLTLAFYAVPRTAQTGWEWEPITFSLVAVHFVINGFIAQIPGIDNIYPLVWPRGTSQIPKGLFSTHYFLSVIVMVYLYIMWRNAWINRPQKKVKVPEKP